MTVTDMTPADYDAVMALWRDAEGVGLGSGDAPEEIAAFLERNPRLSLVAREGDELLGAVLCGHDGRRGYLHHLAVARGHRGRGLGRRLVEACLARLAARGLGKCHIFVHADNEDGKRFWQRLGWVERTELRMMSRSLGPQG